MKNVIYILLLSLPIFANGQSGIISTIAGIGTPGYSGDGGPATAAQLNHPDDIKFDMDGNMYIPDELNHTVRKISTSGIISTVAGNGTHGYSGDNGPATNAKLYQPTDVAFDAVGNMYISEFINGTIRKVAPTGIITTFAGIGTNGFSGDGGPATAAQLADPLGLVFDSKGNLYFSCNDNFRIRKISASGIITTIAGTGVGGYSGDGGPATMAQVRLTGYLAVSPTGDLYIPDFPNHRIRKVDPSGIITTFAGTGTSGYNGDNGPASAATFASPFSLILDHSGNMYITDKIYYVIRKINSSSIITTIAGNGTVGFSGDGGAATAAQFGDLMNCSAVDAFGNLYIGDPNNNRIRKITYNNVGVIEINNSVSNVSIYPNPATDELIIKMSKGAYNTFTITNSIGQVMIQQHITSTETSVPVNGLPVGMYFILFKRENGVEVKRFVKE